MDSVFGFERPEDSPGFLLWQTTVTWQRLIKAALAPKGVTHSEFVILACLLWLTEHGTEITQVMVARMTGLDKMTVSNSLKDMLKQGLVTRSESKKDTRAKKLGLTSKGKKFISELIPIVEGIDEEFFGVLSDRDQKKLIQILAKLSG
jgi:DNA-binding MarR family transcriptional regulator